MDIWFRQSPKMINKTEIEIRAPHNGTVEDVNIYGVSPEVIDAIVGDISDIASFVTDSKAEIDTFDISQDGTYLTLVIGDIEFSYELGDLEVEVTYGGLAYNTFRNLLALNTSLGDKLSLRPIIGVPNDLLRDLRTSGIHQESEYLLSAKVRKSLMLISRSSQLNLVTLESVVQEEPTELDVPEISVFSSYPRDTNDIELELLRQYARQNPEFRVYFNPGGTQIRLGAQNFRNFMHLVRLSTMKLDEAIMFLGIEEEYTSRIDMVRECADRLLEQGMDLILLNESERGTYMATEEGLFHTIPFPISPIERVAKRTQKTVVQNFSGCGDAMFSVMLYASEVYKSMTPEERLTYANAITRLISLNPESNLCNVNDSVISDTFNEARKYSDLVTTI